MDKKKNDSIILLLLVLNFLALSTVILPNVNLPDSELRFYLFFGDVALVLACYVYLRKKYQNKFDRVVDKVNKYHDDIVKNNKIDLAFVLEDDDLVPFYDSFSKIDGWLNIREENYVEVLELINSVATNMEIDKLLEGVMPKLLELTNSSSGAFYLVNNVSNMLEIKYSIGFSKNVFSEFDIDLGEGFLGQAVLSSEIKIIKNIPDDTIYFMRTFLGKIKPKNIMIVPISDSKNVVGVLVLSSIFEYGTSQNTLINIIRSYLGIAVSNALIFERTKRLTNELKFQNRLIQDLNDDLERKVEDRTLFLNSIIDSIEDYAIYALDKDFRITAWNKGATAMLGYERDEVIGRNLEVLYDEGELETKEKQESLKLLKEVGKLKKQGIRKKKDGTLYYADMNFFKMCDKDGNILGFTNVTRDISALRKAEDDLWIERGLFQKILESSSRTLLVTDPTGMIQLYNINLSRMLSTPELFGRNISDFFENSDELIKNIGYIAESNSNAEITFKLKHTGQFATLRISCLKDKAEIQAKLFIHIVIKDDF